MNILKVSKITFITLAILLSTQSVAYASSIEQANITRADHKTPISDITLKGRVCSAIYFDKALRREAINVDIQNGKVTLTGNVSSKRLCNKLMAIVQNASGSHNVVNNTH